MKVVKRRGQKEHSKQGDINKTNLYLNNTYNETSKTLLWLYNCSDIGLAVRVFANGPEDLGSIPGRVIAKTQKTVLDASLLNTYKHYSIIRYGSRVKWSNLGKGVAPSPTP